MCNPGLIVFLDAPLGNVGRFCLQEETPSAALDTNFLPGANKGKS